MGCRGDMMGYSSHMADMVLQLGYKHEHNGELGKKNWLYNGDIAGISWDYIMIDIGYNAISIQPTI